MKSIKEILAILTEPVRSLLTKLFVNLMFSQPEAYFAAGGGGCKPASTSTSRNPSIKDILMYKQSFAKKKLDSFYQSFIRTALVV